MYEFAWEWPLVEGAANGRPYVARLLFTTMRPQPRFDAPPGLTLHVGLHRRDHDEHEVVRATAAMIVDMVAGAYDRPVVPSHVEEPERDDPGQAPEGADAGATALDDTQRLTPQPR